MSELTPWFDGKKFKPARKGVYMLMSGLRRQIGYQMWDGATWRAWAPSAELAKEGACDIAGEQWQNDNWRGLAKPAK